MMTNSKNEYYREELYRNRYESNEILFDANSSKDERKKKITTKILKCF